MRCALLLFGWLACLPVGAPAHTGHDPHDPHVTHGAHRAHEAGTPAHLGAHGHHHPSTADTATPHAAVSADATTGSGAFVFRHRPLELPPSMAEHLVHAHGGFAQDRREHGGDGATYFSLKGTGLLRLAPDLSAIEVLGGDAAFRDVNLHNTCLVREGEQSYLALPSDEAQRVYLTSLTGGLTRTFPNPYGEGGDAFRVCDVEYAGGLLFAANGYADNVCFATRPWQGSAADARIGQWESWRFGGSGSEHGRFGTAHGITRFPGTTALTVSDRANARLETYSPRGRYIGGIELPAGSMPCDVDYHGDLALVGCLKGPGGSTPAPIYILKDGNLVAELNISRDLGLEGFTHIHNASFHVMPSEDGVERLYVLAYAWNPGGFAILEQVLE